MTTETNESVPETYKKDYWRNRRYMTFISYLYAAVLIPIAAIMTYFIKPDMASEYIVKILEPLYWTLTTAVVSYIGLNTLEQMKIKNLETTALIKNNRWLVRRYMAWISFILAVVLYPLIFGSVYYIDPKSMDVFSLSLMEPLYWFHISVLFGYFGLNTVERIKFK